MKSFEWVIFRRGARIRIYGRQSEAGWSFFEREVGDVRWFDLPATPELVAKAEELSVQPQTDGDESDGCGRAAA